MKNKGKVEAYFLQMVKGVRMHQEVLLHGKAVPFTAQEDEQVLAFLRDEYATESLTYPYTAPEFDEEAALWAAKVLYSSAQLLLYRTEAPENLRNTIQPYHGQVTEQSMISADLMLRFLPDLLTELKAIDEEDLLVGLLEGILEKWPYSALAYAFEEKTPEYQLLVGDPCLKQLAVNRIVAYRKTEALEQPELKAMLKANMGLYGDSLLGNFKLENKEE